MGTDADSRPTKPVTTTIRRAQGRREFLRTAALAGGVLGASLLGRVRVNGLDPRLHRAEVLARVGFVPQLPPPLKMPVGQLLRFAAGVCAADPQRMLGVAERLGLAAILSLRGPGWESATANRWERLSAAIGRPLSLASPQVAAISRSYSCVLNRGRPPWTGDVPK